MKTITKRLRVLRAGSGLIQRIVADKAGMTLSRYHEIEKGYRVPTDRELEAIARVLHVDPSDIVHPPQPAQVAS